MVKALSLDHTNSIVVIAAHPDDVKNCTGALLRGLDLGAEVALIQVKTKCQRLKQQEATDLREGQTDPEELNRLMLADPEKFMQVQAMQPFSKWTEFSENLWEKEESLFFHGSGIETIRGRWARAHVEAFDLASK